jgi:hypothetical protein
MTREKLRDKDVSEQLIIDIARYKGHPDCSVLVCVVYDPESRLSNPGGMERDLTKKHDALDVHVLVVP